MTPQELKNSILQLAIQGKLVEQRPEEGTARELYAQIQAEKRRLIKAGKLKKEKPLPEITEDEKPFEIPEGWMWVRLTEIGSFSSGKTPDMTNKSFWDHGTVNWMTSKDMKEKYLHESQMKITETAAQGMTIYEPGTLLMVVRSGILKRMLPLCILTQKSTINQDIKAYTLVLSSLSTYVYYMLKALEPNILFNYTKRVTTVDSLKFDEFSRQMPVPLPPLAEQHRIVAKIEELLPLMDRYEQAWTKLEDFNRRFPEDLKKSILQQAIQGKLVEQRPEEGTAQELYEQIQAEKRRLIKEGKIKKEKPLPEITDEEKPFDVPEGWRWVRLGMIVSVLGGKRIPAGRKLTAENTGYRYIRVSDMKDGTVSTEDILYVPSDIYPSISRYIINKEDIYITVAGTIGRVGKIPEELDGANLTENADRLVFFCLNQDWLIKCLQSSVIQSQIADATTKVGQPKLAIKRIQELLVPLPPLAGQKRIVERLEELLAMCERLKTAK